MTTLFQRTVNIVVGPKTEGASVALTTIEKSLGLEVSSLDCVFKAKKNLKATPNSCSLRIFNLSPGSRDLLSTPKKLVLRLEAGYPSALAQLFLGEVRTATTSREGSNWITDIETGDSEKELQSAHIALSIGPKVPAQVALTAIARELGIGLGNLPVKLAQLNKQGAAYFGPGTVIFDHASQALDDFCKSADWEWSVQDGVLQILDRGKALENQAVLLSSETGLVGSPSIDHKGIVTAKAFIQPDLRPGHKVAFDTAQFKLNQGYRIQECDYDGDTTGGPWYVTMKCKKY